ncbi:MAG: hypothetical protein K1X89_06790 [Myxococcaceae bacterium]|nr:hypothetical protein [Myxococcaceae bacterium]
MFALTVVLLAAAPSPAEVQMAQGFAQYYDSLVGYRQQADEAMKAKDWQRARGYFLQLGNAVDAALKRIEQAQSAGAWNAGLTFKTKDGTFKSDQFTGALAKLKADGEKKIKLADAAAKDPKQQPPMTAEQTAQVQQQLAKYLDALDQIEGEAKAALDAKDVVKAVTRLRQIDSSCGALLGSLAEQKAKGTLKDTLVIQAKARKLKVQELPALLTKLQASAQKRLKDNEKAYRAELDRQAAEKKAQAQARADARVAAKSAGKRPGAAAGGQRPGAAAPADDAQAPVAAAPVDYYAAATFAFGRCSFGHCATDGWENDSSSTRCNFGKCFQDGWVTTQRDGQVSDTRCNFGNCLKDGWTTTHPDGTTSDTRCNFGNCATDGWSTTYPDGSSSDTRCNFGACMTDGWSTSMPNGGAIECRCSFGNCLTDGAECN